MRAVRTVVGYDSAIRKQRKIKRLKGFADVRLSTVARTAGLLIEVKSELHTVGTNLQIRSDIVTMCNQIEHRIDTQANEASRT